MVSFVTLFLGLVVGIQSVELQADDSVDRIELRLDGEPQILLEHPPWQGVIDLGPNLLPHELVAVAYSRDGAELDRATQWINLPRQPAEVSLVLERDDTGTATRASVSWESLVADLPSAVEASFDGEGVEVTDPRSILLPAHDPKQLHFLRVDIEFGGLVRASSEIAFGGTYLDRITSELTAVPIELTKRRKLPAISTLHNCFVSRGRSLKVAAVEKGAVDLIIVRDRGAWHLLRQIWSQALNDRATSIAGRREGGAMRSQWFKPFESGWDRWTYQFLWPVSTRRLVGDSPYDLFTHSQKYAGNSLTLHGWLTTHESPQETAGTQRLADAVAVAGVTAASGNRRRGVLLVIGKEAEDASESSPATVRHYLRSLAVPLFVVSPDPNTARQSDWGEVDLVSTPSLLERSSRKIFDQLERQRIVWVEGRQLPQQVSLTGAAGPIQLLTDPGVRDGPSNP